jgi:DNA-binding SARP family transcriptional activator/Tfp pilus assembly protein PilF
LTETSPAGAHLEVLGTLGLADSHGVSLQSILVQPKRLALLIYLVVALPRGFHRRDALLAMFWPELDRVRASRALRQALHFLRAHLSEPAITNRGAEEVGVPLDRISCDAVRFETLLDLGHEERALELYRGEMLPGFHLAGAADFSRWLEMERERMRRRAARAASVLAHQCSERKQGARAAEWARVAAGHAPWDESMQAEAALLLAAAGDRRGALRLLDDARDRMGEVGLEGAGPLERVTRQIRSGEAASAQVQAPGRLPHSAEAVKGGSSSSRPSRGVHDSQTAEGAGLEAFHAYIRGRHLSRQRTPASMLRAREHYLAALRLDPNLALAHAGLAEVWSVLPVYAAYPAAEAYPRARQHAAKAIALDPELADAHAYLALATVCYDWDWVRAEDQFNRALALDPSSPDVYLTYALYLLTPTGRFEEAIRAIEMPRQRAPTLAAENAYVAMVCYHAREYARAIREAQLTVEMNQDYPLAWWTLGLAQEQSDSVDAAITSFQRAVELTSSSPLMLAQLGRAHARAGNPGAAQDILARLDQSGDHSGPAPYFTASIYAALGDNGEALTWLEHAYRARSPHLVFLKVAPEMDRLRGEKRFRDLLLRLGLGDRRGP